MLFVRSLSYLLFLALSFSLLLWFIPTESLNTAIFIQNPDANISIGQCLFSNIRTVAVELPPPPSPLFFWMIQVTLFVEIIRNDHGTHYTVDTFVYTRQHELKQLEIMYRNIATHSFWLSGEQSNEWWEWIWYAFGVMLTLLLFFIHAKKKIIKYLCRVLLYRNKCEKLQTMKNYFAGICSSSSPLPAAAAAAAN